MKHITSYIFNKTPLGESGCLSSLYYLLPTQASSFLIHFFFETESVTPHLVAYTSLCRPCVTYEIPCHAIGQQVLPTKPLPRRAEDFPRGDKYFKYVPLLT